MEAQEKSLKKPWPEFYADLKANQKPDDVRWKIIFHYSVEERTRQFYLDRELVVVTGNYRITRCILMRPVTHFQVTEAVCSDADNFCRRVGRGISFRRLISSTPFEHHLKIKNALPNGCRL